MPEAKREEPATKGEPSKAEPPPPSIFRRTRSFDVGGGWEANATFDALSPLLPEIDACYVSLLGRDAKAQGKVRLELRQREGNASGIGDDAFRRCLKAAVEKMTAPPVTSKGGTPTMIFKFDLFPSEKEAPPLTKADADEKVTRLPDGSCMAVAKADCPPNKLCASPEKHPVICP